MEERKKKKKEEEEKREATEKHGERKDVEKEKKR